MIKKPESLKIYNLYKCCEFVNQKIDVQNWPANAGASQDFTYDFVDWVCEEAGGVPNESIIFLPDVYEEEEYDEGEMPEGWKLNFIRILNEEFGEGARYLVSW